MERSHRLLLISMCISLGAVVSAVSSLNVALPDLARHTGASTTQLQWIVDAYSLVFAGLSDPNTLIAVRAVMGLGAAMIMPTTLSIITATFPPESRDRAVGV